jgi:hypothetical protein
VSQQHRSCLRALGSVQTRISVWTKVCNFFNPKAQTLPQSVFSVHSKYMYFLLECNTYHTTASSMYWVTLCAWQWGSHVAMRGGGSIAMCIGPSSLSIRGRPCPGPLTLTGKRILCTAANQGPNFLSRMTNRTNRMPLASTMPRQFDGFDRKRGYPARLDFFRPLARTKPDLVLLWTTQRHLYDGNTAALDDQEVHPHTSS